jgi:hypothetical protein
MQPPVRSVEFDHRPSDEELKFLFPRRNLTGSVSAWRQQGDLLIGSRPVPLLATSIFMLAINVVAYGMMTHFQGFPRGDQRPVFLLFAGGTVFLLAFFALINHWIRGQGPLVVFRPGLKVLFVEGHGGPIALDTIREIVVLDRVPRREDGGKWRYYDQAVLVRQEGRRWFVDLLYHGFSGERFRFAPSKQLAEAVGTTVRHVDEVDNVRDLVDE